jgi:hypothetical protein
MMPKVANKVDTMDRNDHEESVYAGMLVIVVVLMTKEALQYGD